MAHDGNGTFSYTANTVVPDAVAGTTIVSTDFDQFSDEVSTALTLAFMKDGQSTATGAFKMGAQKITGMADGAALTDATSVNQVVDGVLTHCATPSAVGTDAYAVSLPINPVTLVTGAMYSFTPEVANTGACSVDFNSIGAKNIKMADAADPYDGAIQADVPCVVQYDGTSMILINPYFAGASSTSSAAELNVLDGVTGGTVTASKAVVVDASKDIATFGEVTAATFTGTNVDGILGANTPADATALVLKADTSLELATGATVTGILDEDAMGTDSATQLATQQSIKAYVDTQIAAQVFKSTPVTYTGVSQSVGDEAHGLTTPRRASAYAQCIDAGGDGTYAFGDIIPVPYGFGGALQQYGIQPWLDGTNVAYTVADQGLIASDQDGAGATSLGTSNDWEMYVIVEV